MHMQGMGLWGVVVLIADVYALIRISGSGVEPLKKALWIVLIVLLPVLGFVVWWLAGPKSAN